MTVNLSCMVCLADADIPSGISRSISPMNSSPGISTPSFISDRLIHFGIPLFTQSMGDLYSELLVKKDKTAKDSLLKYGLIVLTVLAVFAGLIITPLALIIAVALGIACYFVIPKTDVEYEYLFINGDFDIDMIMSKTKRKKVKSFKLSEADLAAPLDSHRMDYYNGNQNMKVLDF